MAVERLLTEKLGDLGKKIHTGRSRNDQVAVDVRLHMKDAILATETELLELASELCSFGHDVGPVPMVGRTHLQPAMPSTVEMWATGHALARRLSRRARPVRRALRGQGRRSREPRSRQAGRPEDPRGNLSRHRPRPLPQAHLRSGEERR
ncbi:MAG: hypothetical protein IKJ89_05035, partial [Kiritimatiellae bacterium]|nr:hypothetical protein [Kiritimatiellia bacterium]